MAALASSLTSSALVRPSLLHLRSFASLRPSSSPLPLSLSISLPTTSTTSFHLTPLVPHTSGWTQQELDLDVDEPQLDADADADFSSSGEEAQWETQGQEEGATDPEDGAGDEDYVEPPEEAKLFVGGIPFDITSEKLAELFDQAGTVEVAEIIYNRDTDQSRGFGFLTMSTVEEADKAIEMFDRYELNGRLLKVNRAAPRGTRVERQPRESRPQFSIYVGNLSWGVDEARLEQIFSEYGKVVSSRVMYDRESGRSRGFGFVAMETKEEMDDAIAALDGKDLDGRALRVNIAEDRRRPSAF